jgi:aminoglycoside phosphotransferase (APT) family kinase protein
LLALDPTLLHGEFYASNVLVALQPDSLRVCPVDWELAAIGPGLMDLGALIAGSWSEEEKRELARAYYVALAPREATFEELLESLDYCRLQIAVQWLGWSPDWSPPPEHAHNWLREAISLAANLKL